THPQLHTSLFPYTTLFRSTLRGYGTSDPIAAVVRAPSSVIVDAFTLSFHLSAILSTNLYPSKVILLKLRSRSLLFSYFETKAFRSEEHTSELQSRFDLVCR